MAAPQRPENLVEVEDIEERFHLDRSTIWRKVREGKLWEVPGSGVYRPFRTRSYRFNPHEFGKWLMKGELPYAKQPSAPDIKAQEPSPLEALNLLSKRIDHLQAGQTRLEEKIDTINRAILAIIRNGKSQDATAGNKRLRRS